MESVPSTSMVESDNNQSQTINTIRQDPKESTVQIFSCSYCLLRERFDFKGAKPPFARQITYLEDCYIMKDPFSLPNKGEVLVIGADCSVCKKPVCLGCSIYFGKRFCLKCASSNSQHLPTQLHPKIQNLIKNTES